MQIMSVLLFHFVYLDRSKQEIASLQLRLYIKK